MFIDRVKKHFLPEERKLTRLRIESDNVKKKYPFPIIGIIGGVSLPDSVRRFSVLLGQGLCKLLLDAGSLFSCGTSGVGYIVLDRAFESFKRETFRRKVFTLIPHNTQPSYLDANIEYLGKDYEERDIGLTRFFADILLSVGGESYNPHRRFREDVDRTELQLEEACTYTPLILFTNTGGETEKYARRLTKMGYPEHKMRLIPGDSFESIEQAVSFIRMYFSHIYLRSE